MRANGRQGNELRAVSIKPAVNKYAEGSVLIHVGDTQVLCTASIEDKVPPFMKGQGRGWVTAEYAMLPRATQVRNQRESARGRLGGRTMEIQRLIGRSLRSVVNLAAMGERTITLDCDVIQADGGTRTTSITGAFVAMVIAMAGLVRDGKLSGLPVTDFLASVSAGIVDGEPRVDLCYEEDSRAKVDMNVVMTGSGALVEIQGTGEESPFRRDEMDRLLSLSEVAIRQLIEIQKRTLASVGVKFGE